MPWKAASVLDERIRFVLACERGAETMTSLCAQYGVTRETGYKWLSRYREGGWAALADQSRAPHRQAGTMSPEVSAAIVALRQERPSWGPKKLRAVLMRRSPEVSWPAASSIGDLLKREGLVTPRRRDRTVSRARSPFVEPVAPNDLWCIDFKGWFRTRDGRRCDPLTVTDAVSRYLLRCQITEPTTAGVWSVCEGLFRECGLPATLRMDNGPPFASRGAGGLTELSVRWVKLGIRLERIEPGQPQQNGRHERMHLTLKQETSRPPAATAGEQQIRFDRFRQDFNEVRPHEALDQTTPASCYQPARRPWPDKLEDPWYDADHQVRSVRRHGEIKWQGELVFISVALVGQVVGLAETPTGDWLVRFADLELGILDRRQRKFLRFAAPRPGRRKAVQTRDIVSHVPGP